MPTPKRKRTLFLGEPMDVDHYDDEVALTAYVWHHYLHLMTALEKRVGLYIVPIVSDSPIEKSRLLHKIHEERDGQVSDADVLNAAKIGRREFRNQAMKRLQKESPSELIINRCLSCNRLTPTPIARQCIWCGTAWRD